MSAVKNEVGNRYGRLFVVEQAARRPGSRLIFWSCDCDCGKRVEVAGTHLRTENTKSCGCLAVERARAVNTKHGDAPWGQQQAPLYRVWAGIKTRTTNENSSSYGDYGGRGVTMHEPWLQDYREFKSWILANLGECPGGHSLDRIDPDGNYEPGNLRWLAQADQQRNKSGSRSRVSALQELRRQYDDLAAWVTSSL